MITLAGMKPCPLYCEVMLGYNQVYIKYMILAILVDFNTIESRIVTKRITIVSTNKQKSELLDHRSTD
jgi:hypothetical protein